MVIRSISTTGVIAFLPYYISTYKGAGVSALLGLTLSLMYIAAIFGQILFGVLVDKFDKKLILAAASAGSAISILGYISTTGILELVFILLFGLFTFSVFAALFGLTWEHYRGHSSTGNALVWGLGITGGNVIGPIIVGLIIADDYSHLNFAFEVMALIGLVGALITLFVPKTRQVYHA
jgi:MFS family permease